MRVGDAGFDFDEDKKIFILSDNIYLTEASAERIDIISGENLIAFAFEVSLRPRLTSHTN